VKEGNVQVVCYFLDHGADVNMEVVQVKGTLKEIINP
jgi:hypothetical protein